MAWRSFSVKGRLTCWSQVEGRLTVQLERRERISGVPWVRVKRLEWG